MKTPRAVILNNRGFNLVGVLAAVGILGVVAVGVMTVAQNITQTARTADVKAAVQEEIFLAQALLSTESNCTVNFKGLSIDNKERAFDINGGKLYLSTSPGVYTLGKSPIFSSQTSKTSSVDLKKIEYRLYQGSDNVMILGLSFEPRGTILGGSLRTREIPLHVSVKNNRIESCVALGFKAPDIPDDLDDADTKTRGQGRGCSGTPPGQVGAAAMKDAIKNVCKAQAYPVTKGLKISQADLMKCQKLVERTDDVGKECRALRALALSESLNTLNKNQHTAGDGDSRVAWASSEVTLKSRNGYKSEAECINQQQFSEGDNYVTEVYSDYECRYVTGHNVDRESCAGTGDLVSYTCVNGRWSR